MYYSFSLFLSSYVFVSFLFMSHPITIFVLFISFPLIYLFPSCLFLSFIFLLLFSHFFSFNNLRFFSFYNTPIIYLIYLMDYSSLLVMRKIEAIKFACAWVHTAYAWVTGVVFSSLFFSLFF